MEIRTDVISERLPEQRWFGGKGRTIASVEEVDHAVLDDGPPAFVLAIFRIRYEDGGEHLYQFPLLVDEDGSSRDVTDDPDRLRLFGDLMAHGDSIKGDKGIFRFGGPGLDPLSPPGHDGVRVMAAEQSNTSFVLDEDIIVKLFRRVAFGPNPDLELTRFLTNEAFQYIPPHLGEAVYETETEEEEESEIDLAIAQRFIHGAQEGWEMTLRHVRELYDAIDSADVREDMRFLTEERAGRILDMLADLGETTALLHVALAREDADPELAAQPIEDSTLKEWADRARLSLRELEGKGLDELIPDIEARIDLLSQIKDPGHATRVHGDYHLGQVVRANRTWYVLDFEGEPARTLEERAAKQSALRDVAGMLRSFSYAASAVLFERADPDSEEWSRLEPWADTWEELARDRFLHAYLTRSHEGRFLTEERDDLMVMLGVFEVDKAIYEVGYEIGHRPEWVRIPLRGIAKVIERTKPGDSDA